MWVFVSINSDERFHLLQDKPKYVVSRNEQNGDMVLAGDTSISRLHAFLYPTKGHVKIIDGGSKYGIFINDNIYTDIQVPKNQPAELCVGDQIRFGRLKNLWRLETVEIVTISSKLSATEKVDLVKDINILNGTCLNDWNSTCNYITVSNILLTIKVLLALSAAIPIVTPNYWKAYITAIRNKSTPPLPDANFLPPISEPYLPADVSFLPNINRRRLFAGKTIVFMIRGHKEKFQEIIKLAGGDAISLDDNKIRKRSLISGTNIVIQYNPFTQSQTTQDISDVNDYVRSNGLRTIPDSEIGLAIVYCSLAKFCNPKFKLDEDFVPTSPQAALPSTSKFLAESTPAELFKIPMNVEVAETVESEKAVYSTRNTSAKNDIPSAALEEASLPTRSNSKRTAAAPIDDAPPPKKKNTITSKADKDNLSSNTEPLEASNEPSQSVQQPSSVDYFNIDDDDDILLASLVEKVESVEMPMGQSNMILPISGTTPSTAYHNHSQQDGFISTNRTRKTAIAPTNVSTPAANRKRIHDLLNADGSSGDESDDNLFKFEKAPVPTKKTKTTENNVVLPPEENETIFLFSTQPSSQQVPTNKQAIPKSTTVSSGVSRMNSKSFDIRKKPIPLTADGWLSKNTIKHDITNIKTELNVTTDAADRTKSEENTAWINSLQNVFVAEFKKMNLVNRSIIQSGATAGGSNAKDVKNFKAFVKKIYRPLHARLLAIFEDAILFSRALPSSQKYPNLRKDILAYMGPIYSPMHTQIIIRKQ